MAKLKTNKEASKNLAEVRKMKKIKESNTATEIQIAEMLKNKYDEVREFKNYRYAAVRKWDKWWFVDWKWKEISDIVYDEVKDFEFEWYAPVKLNWKWGLSTFQSRDGKDAKFFLEFPCEYEDLINMYDSTFAFKENWKWGIMDLHGKVIIPCEYDKVSFNRWIVYQPLRLTKWWKEYEINPRTREDIEESFAKYKE